MVDVRSWPVGMHKEEKFQRGMEHSSQQGEHPSDGRRQAFPEVVIVLLQAEVEGYLLSCGTRLHSQMKKMDG